MFHLLNQYLKRYFGGRRSHEHARRWEPESVVAQPTAVLFILESREDVFLVRSPSDFRRGCCRCTRVCTCISSANYRIVTKWGCSDFGIGLWISPKIFTNHKCWRQIPFLIHLWDWNIGTGFAYKSQGSSTRATYRSECLLCLLHANERCVRVEQNPSLPCPPVRVLLYHQSRSSEEFCFIFRLNYMCDGWSSR